MLFLYIKKSVQSILADVSHEASFIVQAEDSRRERQKLHSMQVLADDQKRAIKTRADHEAAVKLLGEAKALVSNGKTKQAQEFLNRCTQQLQAANLLWRLQGQIDAVQARCNMATRFW